MLIKEIPFPNNLRVSYNSHVLIRGYTFVRFSTSNWSILSFSRINRGYAHCSWGSGAAILEEAKRVRILSSKGLQSAYSKKSCLFLAVKNSSIGDLVTHTLSDLLILEHKTSHWLELMNSHSIRVMRRHDLTIF